MKKFIPTAVLTAATMVALTLTAIEKQSSFMETPLLSANVEALSAVEAINPNVYNLADGSVLYLNMENRVDKKGRMTADCISSSGFACIKPASGSANVDWYSLLRRCVGDTIAKKMVEIVKGIFNAK